MEEKIKKSTRQEKSEKVKEKLIKAMALIIEKYDYDTLTIRNICAASGVSSGSFYNLFESKERFLTYYLTNDFLSYRQNYYAKSIEFEKLAPLEKIIDIFKCCGEYNDEKGLQFICSFYSPYNHSLAPVKEDKDRFFFLFAFI